MSVPESLPRWRSFVSWGTVLSALPAILVFGLLWNWAAGLFVVVLLYLHEVGHVLAAHWRRVPIRRAPFFLPGLGAFVAVEGSRLKPWDRVLFACGGPAVGILSGLVAKGAGIYWGLPALAFAGHIALFFNLFNLAPFFPLDGGQMVIVTGWLGLLPTLTLGAFVVYALPDPFFKVAAVVGLWFAVRAARSNLRVGWGIRLGAFFVYVVMLAGAVIALVASGELPLPEPAGAPGVLWFIFSMQWLLVYALVSAVLLPFTQRPGVRAAWRYLALAVLGWPLQSVSHPWQVLSAACLGAQTLRLPGLQWLPALVRFLARRAPTDAGVAAARGYDYLRHEGSEGAAADWLESLLPELRSSNKAAMEGLITDLIGRQHAPYALHILHIWRDGGALPPDVSPLLLNNVAWALAVNGRPAAALPYARAAVAADIQPWNQSTLGRTLVELGQYAEAEPFLRTALDYYPGAYVSLARALAGQGRYDEAVTAAERALSKLKGRWPSEEPDRAHVLAWIPQWRAHKAVG